VSRRVELAALFVGDALALCVGYAAFSSLCVRAGWTAAHDGGLALGAALSLGWLVLFFFSGLYGERYAGGRFDELVTLAKVTAFGALAVFFGYYLDRLAPASARVAVAAYGGSVFAAVGLSRIAIRTVQRALVVRGYGRHRAVVVGWSDRVETLYHDLARYPAAGLEIVGAVRLRHPVAVSLPSLAFPEEAGGDGSGVGAPGIGTSGGDGSGVGDALPPGAIEVTTGGAPEAAIAELPRLLDRIAVQDVLIALGPDDHAYLDEVLRVCDGRPVTLKLVPDFYTAIGGMARTEHMYGLPLIEVLPEPIPAWEKRTKRIVDVLVAAAVIVAGLPVWALIAAAVRLTSPGEAIYRQTRVGRGGRPFTMLKFRTMVQGAERDTGPVWAQKADVRVTPLGRWLRRLRLDELPQFWNVLVGEMSLVGPRPERPFFVEKLVREIPLYSRRHRVQPGITGLAQVKWRYDSDLDDVRQKLKYDLFYIETMSLRLDAKILLQTVRTALRGEGQ